MTATCGTGRSNFVVICHLSPSYVADTIRQNFPALGIVEDSNVTTLRR